jgi:SAM-dependent methyltransferase
MKSQVYNQAKYYELAFSFVDSKKQADLFEKIIKKYSQISVSSVLDLACGTALQLREMAKRGYKSIALDANSKMIGYLKSEFKKKGLNVETIKADINNFKIKQKIDFVYIMMGSIIYVKDNNSFLSHLDSVADSLNSGGLYLIENMAINWDDSSLFKPQRWTMKKGRVKVKTTYQITPKNALKQIVTQLLKLEVVDNGEMMEFIDKDSLKIVFPEELKLLVDKNHKFELLGFFERNNMKLLKRNSPDNVVLLRRK